jgi:hypothetical protein
MLLAIVVECAIIRLRAMPILEYETPNEEEEQSPHMHMSTAACVDRPYMWGVKSDLQNLQFDFKNVPQMV